jgi:hypothetical protein
MQFTLLIHQAPGVLPAEGSDAMNHLMRRYGEFNDALKEAGVFVAADRLHGPETAASVNASSGEALVTDGPFAETREWLAGFYLIDVPDRQAAIGWAKRLPGVDYGTVEVRPVRAMR